MRRLFGTDGVRGVANDFLSCEIALEIGRALGSIISQNENERPKVLIGMDTRISSDMLTIALGAGLCSAGCDVLSLGVIPTPAVAYLTVKYGAQAGVMISASHNSFEYNGIKIFGADGFKLSDELEEEIESIVFEKKSTELVCKSENIGRFYEKKEAKADYLAHLKETCSTRLDGLKIAIDCANGASSAVAEELFTELGAKCFILSNTPDGININDKCGSTHLGALKEYVKANALDAGIAFDGDADRCIAIDENGREIDGDYILAMLSLKLKGEGKLKKNTVVGTVLSNYGFQKFCADNNINFIAAKVGDRYVLELINMDGYCLGGEQSGHIILRDHATTGDGMLTAIFLLAHMAEEKKSLGTLANVMQKYPQYAANVRATNEEKLLLFTDSQIKEMISATEERLVGYGRLVVRPSGTEPLIRIMVEGEEQSEVEAIAKGLAENIQKRLDEKRT